MLPVVPAIEEMPVAARLLFPGTILDDDMIDTRSVKSVQLTAHTLRDRADIIGQQLRYIKNPGNLFSEYDLRPIIVIENQQKCNAIISYHNISITVPAVALKNGNVGSKIRVLCEPTRKIVEAIVRDSKNVEVIVN